MGKVKQFIKGTLSATFQLAASIILGTSGGVLQVLGADGTTPANVAAADPTDDSHLVTKGYADANYGAVPGAVRELVFDIGTDATSSSTAELPTGAIVQSVHVDVTTAYSAGAGIKVGNVGDDDEFVDAAASITLTALGTYGVTLRSGARVSAQQVQASISGSPSQGAGKVYVTYSIPATA